MYLAYGDTRLLERQYPSMRKWVEYMRKQAGEFRPRQSGIEAGHGRVALPYLVEIAALGWIGAAGGNDGEPPLGEIGSDRAPTVAAVEEHAGEQTDAAVRVEQRARPARIERCALDCIGRELGDDIRQRRETGREAFER